MKTALYTFALIALLLAGSLPVGAQQSEGARIISTFTYPDIEWSVPEVGTDIQRVVLDNGIILYLMEDHSLPLFNVNALFRCGEAYEPIERMAVPNFVGTIMRTGGTTNIDADSLNTILELRGASVETWIGAEDGGARLSVLSQDIDFGISLLADVLRNPAFPESKIDLLKDQYKNNLKRRNDDPGNIVRREFAHLIYGEHPEGRVLEWAFVKDITRDELLAYHETYFAPNNLMLGITGDFNSTDIIATLNKYFGDWSQKRIAFPDLPKVADQPHPGVYLVYKDLNQANIQFGHLGINRDNPDRHALSVMNYILGGGSFTSRMTSKVRSDEGLAYSVGTRFGTGDRDLGTFFAYTQTKSETTHKAVSLMVDEIRRIREGLVTDEELESAKDSYINRYVFNFDSAGEIINRLMRLEFDDRPRDLLKNYIDDVRKVTKDDVLRVARKYLTPEKMTYLVVGKSDDFEMPLDEFGPVTIIELTDPVLE